VNLASLFDLPSVVPAPACLARLPGSESGSRLLAQVPLARPFPPSPPPPILWLCSELPGTMVCPTSRVRSSSDSVLGLPDTSQAHWLLLGKPGSLTSVQICPYVPGSQTAQDPSPACDNAGPDVAFRVVSGRRRPEVRGISRLNCLARSSPVYASYLTLRPCPQDSEPVWLARPSPYDSFIRYILPVLVRSARVPQGQLLLPSKSTVLTHRVDATTLHPW